MSGVGFVRADNSATVVVALWRSPVGDGDGERVGVVTAAPYHVNGGAPFPVRQLLRLQRHTMVHSMRPTHRATHSRNRPWPSSF